MRAAICASCGHQWNVAVRPGPVPKWCSSCRPEVLRQRNNAAADAWRVANREAFNQQKREYYAKNKRVVNSARLKTAFNITQAQYDEMLATQGGVCAICGGVCPMGRALAVDHDHSCCPQKSRSCGRCIRGLLCSLCNTHLVAGYERLPRELQTWTELNEYLNQTIAQDPFVKAGVAATTAIQAGN